MWLVLLKNWKWAAIGVLAAALAATYWMQDMRIRAAQAQVAQRAAELSACQEAVKTDAETITELKKDMKAVQKLYEDLAASKAKTVTRIRTIQNARGACDTPQRASAGGGDELLALLNGMFSANADRKN